MPVKLLPRYRITRVAEPRSEWTAYRQYANSQEAYNAFRDEMCALDREHFIAITLDPKNRTIGHHTVSIGSLSGSIVHPREVYKAAILDGAASILFLHNHPSGDPAPSREDRECTDRLCHAGKILGIRVLDHIVIGDQDYFSFADSGLLPSTATQ